MFKQFLISLQIFILNLTKGQSKNEFYFCSIPLLFLSKFTDIQVPDELYALFNLALSMLIFSIAILGAMFNLLLTFIILNYKNKYNLELKFKNYPLLVRILKFYEKASYINIIWEICFILFCILCVFVISLAIVLKTTNIT
jgi:hypothetical protein